MRLDETSRLFSFSIVLWGIFSGLAFASQEQWHAYFASKLPDPPEPFIVSGLKKIPQTGAGHVAIDLGSGIGHETKLLLDKGYNVIAVDENAIALQYMKQLPGIAKHQAHLKTINAKFEQLNFSKLPRADLVISSFALPFVSKGNFHQVWHNISSSIKPGGYIMVNLFDAKFSFYNNKHTMSFHTKNEALALFKGFKIIEFRTVRSDSSGKKSLYYVVIAQKLLN